MKNKFISIVVPIYNVEEYVGVCIESILNQDYQNFELLLVDDGSTDNSGLLCEKYKNKDNRIRLFHKENGGLSDARNYGIDRAKGEFITFVDSDDTIKPNYLSTMVKAQQKYNADIVQVSMYTSQADNMQKISEKSYTGKGAFEQLMLFRNIKVYACGKLYKLSLFNKYKFRYPKGKIMEDSFTTYKLLLKSHKVIFLDDKLYFYRQRSDSIMNLSFNQKNLVLLQVPTEIKQFLNNNKIDVKNKFLNYYLIRINCNIYNRIISSDAFNDSYLNDVRCNIITTLKNCSQNLLEAKYRIMIVGITQFTWIYNILIRLTR